MLGNASPLNTQKMDKRMDRPDHPEEGTLKKAKIDPRSNTEYKPTKVLFVRGLSFITTERDLVEVCSEAGIVESMFILPPKGQAFVEFDCQEAADFCLMHFNKEPANLHGNQLHFSYSGRDSVTRRTYEPTLSSKSLLIVITEVRYPVTQDIVSQILLAYGRVLKCRIFPRTYGYQVLVDLDTLEGAVQARAHLDGKHIYSGCNCL
jgi:RNA recognition motif-containing protein